MRTRCWPIILLFVTGLLAAGESPFVRAERVLNSLRDEVHKREMKIVWPDAATPDLPDDAEVYLIHGYISYACTRLTWTKGAATAERVETKRTWFYNASGESVTASRLAITRADFTEAWRAANLILGAKAERITPEVQDADGAPRFPSLSSSHGSHEKSQWVRVSVPAYTAVVRGTTRPRWHSGFRRAARAGRVPALRFDL